MEVMKKTKFELNISKITVKPEFLASKHCQRAFATSIFRECVTCQKVTIVNDSSNILILLEIQLSHE